MLDDQPQASTSEPMLAADNISAVSSPAPPALGADRFENMVSAARLAMAERDYPRLRDFARQVNQEKNSNREEQRAIAAHLDAVRALLDEFATGVRLALVRPRPESEQLEAFGHQVVLEPCVEGVARYSFDGQPREFPVDRFYDSLRGAAAEELAALADIGRRTPKPGESESTVDRNYRRVYVAMFLAVDNPGSEQRGEFLDRAVELWRESAAEGTDHPVLRKELQDAGALPTE